MQFAFPATNCAACCTLFPDTLFMSTIKIICNCSILGGGIWVASAEGMMGYVKTAVLRFEQAVLLRNKDYEWRAGTSESLEIDANACKTCVQTAEAKCINLRNYVSARVSYWTFKFLFRTMKIHLTSLLLYPYCIRWHRRYMWWIEIYSTVVTFTWRHCLTSMSSLILSVVSLFLLIATFEDTQLQFARNGIEGNQIVLRTRLMSKACGFVHCREIVFQPFMYCRNL